MEEERCVRRGYLEALGAADQSRLAAARAKLYPTNGWHRVFGEWVEWLAANPGATMSYGQRALLRGIERELRLGMQPNEPKPLRVPLQSRRRPRAAFLDDPSLLPKRPPQRTVPIE